MFFVIVAQSAVPILTFAATAADEIVASTLVLHWWIVNDAFQPASVSGFGSCSHGNVMLPALEPSAFRPMSSIFFNERTRVGTIEMLAVDPAAQAQGIGTALTEFAVERIRQRGMTMAFVETGGDPGHAAARRTYEAAGFTALPAVRYFRIVAGG